MAIIACTYVYCALELYTRFQPKLLQSASGVGCLAALVTDYVVNAVAYQHWQTLVSRIIQHLPNNATALLSAMLAKGLFACTACTLC